MEREDRGGCHLNDCHYNPEGNYDAMGNTLMAKRILESLMTDAADPTAQALAVVKQEAARLF